ncbi:Flp family type IVb pilin [Vibrio astriarenae]
MLTKMFVNAQVALQKLKNDERGVTAIEYAIIGVAISAIVLAVFGGADGGSGISKALSGAVSTIAGNIDAAASGAVN